MRLHPAFALWAGAASAIALLQGCAVSGSPQWDSQFGATTRALQAQQRLDPDGATHNAEVPARVDGQSARQARDRYVESYAAPAPSTVSTGAGNGK